ncbi:oligosaccharide flippase family protein [Citrobacter sp. Cpo015]|uniref:oligosaccharide flippase family protein n=1 Tax=Citrobacter sp. Cpo015 TaxID=2985121 RepID=UPI002575DEBF|nr:oligosaccharide flippase family protein [Citrobacter sp. Cpo015]MDM2904212.1 oligosaccharide flippase family protein [Citrobacter sp. Cpo015]
MEKNSMTLHFIKLGSSNLIKMLVGFIYLKIISSYITPEEFGSLGQFLTFVAIVSMLSLGGGNNGMVKYLSENKGDYKSWLKVFNQNFTIVAIINIILFFILFFFANEFSFLIFTSVLHADIIRYYAIVQLFVAFGLYSNVFFISGVDTWNSSLQTVFNSALFLITVLIGVLFFTEKSLIYTAMFVNLFMGIYGVIYFFKKRKQYCGVFSLTRIESGYVKKLSGYAMVTISGAVLWPVSQFILRKEIGTELGWGVVGYWFASIKISDAYIQFFSIFLLSYLYPKLSSVNKKDIKVKNFKGFMVFYIPMLIGSLIVVYFGRDIIVWLLLGKEFKLVASYVQLQIIGDVIKLLYSSLLMYILSCGKVKYSIAVEFLNSIVFISATLFLISYVGWRAPLIGYVITQSITLLYVYFYYEKVRKIEYTDIVQ